MNIRCYYTPSQNLFDITVNNPTYVRQPDTIERPAHGQLIKRCNLYINYSNGMPDITNVLVEKIKHDICVDKFKLDTDRDPNTNVKHSFINVDVYLENLNTQELYTILNKSSFNRYIHIAGHLHHLRIV